jgi:hypothetical protein
MTDGGFRTGAPRDVPPPRPVPAPAAPVEETGVGRAARAVADAVSGLIGNGPDGGAAAADRRRAAAAGLRDVIGAVAGAVGGAFAPGRDGEAPAPGGAAPDGSDRSPGAVLGDLLAAAAPRLPIRDAGRLREAYPGASDDEIAEALVARAARLTSRIGAATGGLSAAQWFAPPSLLAVPLELGAETVLLGSVETVLIGELHELYGCPAPGDARARAGAYLASWSTQRSVDRAGGLGALLGQAGIRALRRRVGRRLAGTATSAAPLMIGAAVSSRLNRRATESLAARVLADLRAPRPPG